MSKLTSECDRRFEKIELRQEKYKKEMDDRLKSLEKFQTVTVTVVVVANFIWVYFIYPVIAKLHGLGKVIK